MQIKGIKRIYLYILMNCLFAFSCTSVSNAANWYIDSSATGSNNGTSWANAWTGFEKQIVSPGDVVYISGGTNSKTYSTSTSANQIKLQAGVTYKPGAAETSPLSQHSGTVILNNTAYVSPAVIVINGNNVTLDGTSPSGRKINVQSFAHGIFAIGKTGFIIKGVEFTNNGSTSDSGTNGSAIYMLDCNGVIDNIWIHSIGNYLDTGIFVNQSNTALVTYYDAYTIKNSTITMGYKGTVGPGADGIKTGSGVTVDNCVLNAIPQPSYAAGQHIDAIQFLGDYYVKATNNLIYDWPAQTIYVNGNKSHIMIYNNLFYNCFLEVTLSGEFPSNVDDVTVANNTMVDHRGGGSINLPTTGVTYSNVKIVNNILVGGDPLINTASSGYTCGNQVIINNNVGSGLSITCQGSPYTQPNDNRTNPSFVSYTPGAKTSNNMQLRSSDTVAKDKGSALSLFNTDIKGIFRPQGSAWDIGVYEYNGPSSGLIPNPPTIIDVR